MAVDIFLKLDGIEGESFVKGHEREIQIESFSFGVSNAGSFNTGGGSAGKAQFNDFHFVMATSKASPKLLVACASGQHIKDGLLSVRKAGTSQLDYIKWTFTDLLISSYQTGGSSGDVVPSDQVSISFAKIEIDYTEQNADGSAGPVTHGGWDLKGDKPA